MTRAVVEGLTLEEFGELLVLLHEFNDRAKDRVIAVEFYPEKGTTAEAERVMAANLPDAVKITKFRAH